MRTFIERLAGGQSLDKFFARVRNCAVDITADEYLKSWFRDFFAHVRKSLDQRGYARSKEASEMYDDLRHRWKVLSSQDSDAGKRWKEDVDAFQQEIRAFEEGLRSDKDLSRVRKAHVRLGEQLEDSVAKSGSVGLQLAKDQAAWFWQDLFHVYVPRLLRLVRDIPIPRYVLPRTLQAR